MKDYLFDILKHTHNTGLFEFVKVTGTDDETRIDALSDDKNAIMMAVAHKPVDDFKGTFGMPNLSKLSMLLGCREYQENADITLQTEIRKSERTPISIRFVNESKDFKNEYRLMNHEVINEMLKPISFREPTWDVEFSPNIAGIQRVNFQSSLLSEESTFTLHTDKNNLICTFGDAANHAGEFIFASNVVGKLNPDKAWPVKLILPILKLNDNSNGFKIKISGAGIMELSVDSGLTNYNYYILAQAK